VVPGPDYIWSLDGHDKLADWGFEIYAAIDAYSRKIMWIYIGISNRTGRSVLHQYLHAVEQTGYLPRILRTDHGTECPLVAEAHYGLSRAARAAMADSEEELELQFKDVFYFGSSTHNQRIESWWAQLEKSKLYTWRVSRTLNTISDTNTAIELLQMASFDGPFPQD